MTGKNSSAFLKSWARILRTETASGVFMLASALAALALANSAYATHYFSFIQQALDFGFGSHIAHFSVKEFIKDVLMAIFFLTVGMELKYEVQAGSLSEKETRILPLAGALGGIAVPALFYYIVTHSQPELAAGWPIPTATDIAFALCVLGLVGKNVPSSLKIILMALAVLDDLFGILVLMLVYGHMPGAGPLLWAGLGIFALILLNRYQVRILPFYFIAGIYLWVCFYNAGIHTTLAGVLTGLFVPHEEHGHSPLKHFIHALHPWTAYVILPLFAFTFAGVSLQGLNIAMITDPLILGIMCALLIGKPLGIFAAMFMAIKARAASLPGNISWLQLLGMAFLGGIGFTLSLYFAALAFEGDMALEDKARLGILIGSVLAGLIGFGVQKMAIQNPS